MVADSGSDSSNDSETDASVHANVTVTNDAKCEINKQAPLANLTSDYHIIWNPTGWLTSDIVHQAQVLLHEEN